MNENWLSQFLKNIPTYNFKIDPYYTEQYENIREEINQMLEYELSDEQLKSALHAWHYRDALLERCKRHDFALLRNDIDDLIEGIEENLAKQEYIVRSMNFLSPVLGYGDIGNIISIDTDQLAALKHRREKLFRSRGNKGDENYLTKRAFFELFFIAELLGLKPPTQNYKCNDLITFAEIITKPKNIKRTSISAHYQDYEKVKKVTPVITSLIAEGKKVRSDNKQWLNFLELFQNHIYCHLSVPVQG
ncbi:MAG TPA: hypothetical protein PK657_03630 [Legionella sp.]|nr:hypothetical protein [Legionella sp.]